MAVRNGSDLLLKLATTVVDCTTNQSIDLTVDMIDATTKDSTGDAKEFLGGEHTGTISVEGKWSEGTSNYSLEDIIDAVLAKASVAFVWGGTTTGNLIISGNCLLSNFNASGPKNGEATWSASMQITGQVTRSTVSA